MYFYGYVRCVLKNPYTTRDKVFRAPVNNSPSTIRYAVQFGHIHTKRIYTKQQYVPRSNTKALQNRIEVCTKKEREYTEEKKKEKTGRKKKLKRKFNAKLSRERRTAFERKDREKEKSEKIETRLTPSMHCCWRRSTKRSLRVSLASSRVTSRPERTYMAASRMPNNALNGALQ